jgi:hypothetical protein
LELVNVKGIYISPLPYFIQRLPHPIVAGSKLSFKQANVLMGATPRYPSHNASNTAIC